MSQQRLNNLYLRRTKSVNFTHTHTHTHTHNNNLHVGLYLSSRRYTAVTACLLHCDGSC